MDDYKASCSRIERLSSAAQNIRDCLVCRVCLEYFKEPVTIKCGHIFCRNCILQVASNEQATCPFCNIKIQKRSIPKEGNVTVQACVESFQKLASAVLSDSGINVFESYHKTRSTKESTPQCEKPSTSKIERASIRSEGSLIVTNQKSLKSKDLGSRSRKRSSSQKKKEDTNSIKKYLSNKSDDVPVYPIQTDEKVKNWLENLTPCIADEEPQNILPNSTNHSSEDRTGSSFEISTTSRDSVEQSEKVSKESKFKETEMRLKEAEMLAKKKLSQNLSDRKILRTSNSVPATSHSDVQDWRRVKRLGKEMQAKTFKSLDVSVERVVLNDTVPCNSTNNDSKNITRESDTDISTSKEKSKQNISEKENLKNVIEEYDNKNHSIESTDLPKEEVPSLSCMNQNQMNEIIGIVTSMDGTSTPEKTRNLSDASAVEFNSKIKQLSPLKVKPDDEVSDVGSTDSRIIKRKLSLRMKLPSSETPHSQQNEVKDGPSLERSKSRLSLKLTTIKTNESSTKQNLPSPPIQNLPSTSKQANILESRMEKSPAPSTGSSKSFSSRVFQFKKLGRVCKKRKNVPFLLLGKTIPKEKLLISSRDEQLVSNIIIKSNIQTNIDYKSLIGQSSIIKTEDSSKSVKMISAQEDSQLKFLSTDSQQAKVNSDVNEIINQTMKTDLPMEIDETPPLVSDMKYEEIEEDEELHAPNTIQKIETAEESSNVAEEMENKGESQIYVDIESHLDKNENNNPVISNEEKIQDVLSISSNDSESANYNLTLTRRGKKKFILESNSDSEASIKNENKKEMKKFQKEDSSSSSSYLKRSPLKKKRTHSESSNDDDEDVTSILGKWMNIPGKEQVTKKPKINRLKELVDSSSEEIENNLIDEAVKKLEMEKIKRDPPIDDIISQAKSIKQNQDGTSKIINMPSSLLSADMFDSNDLCAQAKVQKEKNEVMTNSSRTSDKRNSKHLNISPNSSNITIVDMQQFENEKNKTSESNSFNNSDKENDAGNQTCTKVPEVESLEDEIENSQKGKSKEVMTSNIENRHELFKISDSLMDITQEQLALKRIEKDLLGADLSALPDVKKTEDLSTPHRKVTNLEVPKNVDNDSDSDIEVTPITKRRYRRCIPGSQSPTDMNLSDIISPETNNHLIPAITPVRNTRSYPLCHSTPMINTPESKSFRKNEQIVIIISGLKEENRKLVQKFVKKFNADYHNSFTNDTTHVIVETYPDTKAGKKTFKYIQGIGYKKFVVNMQWIIDCLKNDRLMDEDDEKYEVLDVDSLESGSKRSRTRTVDLFKDFAFYCYEPFTDVLIHEFKSLLQFNGAIITSSLNELTSIRDKYRVIVLGTDNLSQDSLKKLKETKCALVLYEWVVDSVSQYKLISLSSYLCEMDSEELEALGFPPQLLIEDETMEEEDESS